MKNTNSWECPHPRIGFTIEYDGSVHTQYGPKCLECGEFFDMQRAAYLLVLAWVMSDKLKRAGPPFS